MNKLFNTLIFCLFISAFGNSQNIDIDVLKSINIDRNKSLDPEFRFLSNSVAPTVIGLPILVFGISKIAHNKQLEEKSYFLAASIATTALTATVLKYSFDRNRPFEKYPFIDKAGDGGTPSFPSGHTSDVFALATSLSLSFPKWYVVVPSYLYAGSVAYSRLHLGVHYPSDVLAGMILGTTSSILTYRAKKWFDNKYRSKKSELRVTMF